MSGYADLYARWVVIYRERMRVLKPLDPVNEEQVAMMARSAALRGDEPPAPLKPKPSPTLADVRQQIPRTVQASGWWVARWLKNMPEGERMQFITTVLGYVLKLEFLDGYRLYLSGAGFIGLGIYCLSVNEVEKGVAAITTGLGIIGHAGKTDKNTEAVKAAAVLQVANSPGPPTPTPEAGVNQTAINNAIATVTSPTLAGEPRATESQGG